MDISSQVEKAAKLLNDGRVWESLKKYDEILEFDPSCSPALINKAIIFHREKKYTDTLNVLSSIKDGERQIDAKLIESSCHFELNKFDKSESCYNVLSSLVDGNNDLIFRVGLSSIQHGFFLTSIKILGKIDTKKSHSFEKNYYLALSYKAIGDLGSSIKCFGNAIREKSESFQLYPLVAATCFQNGMIEEGDKLMNILKDKNNAFFQHVAGIVSHYRNL